MQREAVFINGVILAGGQSRRFGGDKVFAPLRGAALIEHVIRRAAPQVDRLAISADDESRFARFGYPVLHDPVHEAAGGGVGPLAGILAGLDWMADQMPCAHWLASFSADAPLLPIDLVTRLREAAERHGATVACSRSGGRLHPLLALWSPAVRDSLRQALAEGERAAHRFVERQRAAIVDFADRPFDPFANVNTPADLARLAARYGESG